MVANVADATARAEFPEWDCTIKASDGYVFTAPVGKFKPNAFGLYDMHGNAWQWCADGYRPDYYRKSPTDDPRGPDRREYRILRGGCFACSASGPSDARSAFRLSKPPRSPVFDTGFRVAGTVQ